MAGPPPPPPPGPRKKPARYPPPPLPRSRKQRVRVLGQTLADEPGPLPGGEAEAAQALGSEGEGAPDVARAARAEIDRIGLHGEACLPEAADRARHVLRRGDEKPALARLRLECRPRSCSRANPLGRAPFF